MKGGKQLGQTVQPSRIAVGRRLNMLGQHLANQGFEKVKVRGRIAVEVRDDEGMKGVEHIDFDFSDFVAGRGPREIGGDGTVEIDVPDDADAGQPPVGAVPARRPAGKGVWDGDND